MPILVVGTEKNFAALRPRLFAGRVSNKVAGQVRRAMREANPHADIDRLKPGTILTVPDSPEVSLRAELSFDAVLSEGIEAAAGYGKAALDELSTAAKEREAETRAERRLTLKYVEAIPDRFLEDGLAKDVEAAREALLEEDARASERTSRLEKANAVWTEEIDALRELLDSSITDR
jgi:hypothetical protein